MNSSVYDLTCELISRPSVTPADSGCQEVIANRLQERGFDILHKRFVNVDNLWARRGVQTPIFAFAGHTDVVPTGNLDLWHFDPFKPNSREGFLFGRGASDMKSSLAAMVVATERFVEAYPTHRGSIAFLITSDEEGEAVNGSAKLIQYLSAQNIQLDWCLVGEPTSSNELGDTVKVGRRGSLNGVATMQGTLGHVAYPHLTANPIHEVVHALHPLLSKRWDSGTEFFSPSTFQISNLNSGTGAENVIPDKATIHFNFRFNTLQTVDSLQAAVLEALETIPAEIETRVEWHVSGLPFQSKQSEFADIVCSQIQSVTSITPDRSTSGGTSDARFIVPTGTEVVEFGPVNQSIHKINEHIIERDLARLVEIYYGVLVKLLT